MDNRYIGTVITNSSYFHNYFCTTGTLIDCLSPSKSGEAVPIGNMKLYTDAAFNEAALMTTTGIMVYSTGIKCCYCD